MQEHERSQQDNFAFIFSFQTKYIMNLKCLPEALRYNSLKILQMGGIMRITAEAVLRQLVGELNAKMMKIDDSMEIYTWVPDSS